MMMRRSYGLSTDLYQMTMAAAYYDHGLYQQRAVFELFVRKLPQQRSFLLAVGLPQALEYLESLRFQEDEVRYLRTHPAFRNVSRDFFDYLQELRFRGDVWAMAEGAPFFAGEPILRVEAPIIEAQIVETFLLATMNFQSMIASKAARLVTAAGGRDVIEFGTRRAHGTEAGLMAARAAYIAGCAGTSNVEAGLLFGVPTYGTLAHSFIMSFDKEQDAFAAFLKTFPNGATILVDTFDTLAAVELLAREFTGKVPGIRLDSGDLLTLSKQAREILDTAGMKEARIFASNDLNEYLIADLLSRGARIDAFGVGTQLATSFDAPALSGVYKLVGLYQDGRMKMKMKTSTDKATYPGAKQVWRRGGRAGRYSEDLITLSEEDPPEGDDWHSLLTPVMREGKRIDGDSGLPRQDRLSADKESQQDHLQLVKQARGRVKIELGQLPGDLLSLDRKMDFSVRISEKLEQERHRYLAQQE